jgi:DNA-binding response OmpR family regulator
VEDEMPILNLMRLILQSDGYRVLEAASGEQARQWFAKAHEPIDLVISDVSLPGDSGILVALELRSVFSNLRIIISSGYPPSAWNDQEVAELNELPSDSVTTIEKPFSPLTLLDKVHALIGGAEGANTMERGRS